jgi:uncharacterized protein with NAD-binding domain and iron-sulfur cluster
VIGGGWAGCAAAMRALNAGHHVTLFEAARTLGGRARAVVDKAITLDNGQHILLGAYHETLGLMQSVGIDLSQVLERVPMRLGILQTTSWQWRDYASMARLVMAWSIRGFACPQALTVKALSHGASTRVMKDVIEPLCLSALNTEVDVASGRVFLRVLKDAFLRKGFVHAGGVYASSDMLIPKVDLSTLLPSQVAQVLRGKGSCVRLGERVVSLRSIQKDFDHIVVATQPSEAARLLREIAPDWAARVDALEYRSIATVYAQAPSDFCLPKLMCALQSDAQNPAQFVFARREAKGLLAFVVSDAGHWVNGERDEIERRVLAQGEAKLAVALQPVTTILEKRATFACTTQMKRPAKLELAGLSVVGDYIDGPYPSTIEGAVLSAQCDAIQKLK